MKLVIVAGRAADRQREAERDLNTFFNQTKKICSSAQLRSEGGAEQVSSLGSRHHQQCLNLKETPTESSRPLPTTPPRPMFTAQPRE